MIIVTKLVRVSNELGDQGAVRFDGQGFLSRALFGGRGIAPLRQRGRYWDGEVVGEDARTVRGLLLFCEGDRIALLTPLRPLLEQIRPGRKPVLRQGPGRNLVRTGLSFSRRLRRCAMKVLVAGATGAIGRPLIRCLKEGRSRGVWTGAFLTFSKRAG